MCAHFTITSIKFKPGLGSSKKAVKTADEGGGLFPHSHINGEIMLREY